ncbi:MAG: hypothetical protein CMN76_15040 [Spirochaetaceae bacterium]|nr:hypothetical protein [Spirochaetaceae bacterium]|tara:strand:+ start:54970 stop:55608 length:639 start_codon:yes stop_codon:yes gene_type:complete
MQRFDYPLSAERLRFDAELYLPADAELEEAGNVIRSHRALDHGLGLLRVSWSDEGLFAFLGLLQELPGTTRNDSLGDSLLDCLDEDSNASMNRLSAIACENQQSLKCLILEVKPADQEDPEDYYLARVYAAGMPPLLLIDEGNYRIPTRSGIPLGISPDLEQPSQSLEWDRGGILHFHTDIAGVVNMETLHQDLISFQMEQYQEAFHVRLTV